MPRGHRNSKLPNNIYYLNTSSSYMGPYMKRPTALYNDYNEDGTCTIVHFVLDKNENYINQNNLIANKSKEVIKPRCCGRCDGVYDICVADMECGIDGHETYGCEICYGPRRTTKESK